MAPDSSRPLVKTKLWKSDEESSQKMQEKCNIDYYWWQPFCHFESPLSVSAPVVTQSKKEELGLTQHPSFSPKNPSQFCSLLLLLSHKNVQKCGGVAVGVKRTFFRGKKLFFFIFGTDFSRPAKVSPWKLLESSLEAKEDLVYCLGIFLFGGVPIKISKKSCFGRAWGGQKSHFLVFQYTFHLRRCIKKLQGFWGMPRPNLFSCSEADRSKHTQCCSCCCCCCSDDFLVSHVQFLEVCSKVARFFGS